MAERTLVTARDAKGNTFQMTPEDAKRSGYTVDEAAPVAGPAPAAEPAAPEADGGEEGDVDKKAQQAAPNKAVTSPANTKSAPSGK